MTTQLLHDDVDGTTRRSLLGTAAAVAAGGLAGLGTLAASSEPAAAIDGDPAAFEAGDAPTVTSNDGRIESVYLSPTVDVSWSDFAEGVETVTLVLAVGGSAGVDEVYRETLSANDPSATPGDVVGVTDSSDGSNGDTPPDFDAVDGGLTATFERADATARGDAVTSDALSDPDLSGGEVTTSTLDVVFRADVTGGTDDATVVRTTTVDATVANPAGDARAGGEVGVDTA